MSPSKRRKRDKHMRKLRTIGVPDAEIGRRLGVSRERVGQILGRKKR